MSGSTRRNRVSLKKRRSRPAWNRRLVNSWRKGRKSTPRHELTALPCPPKPGRRRMLDKDHRGRPQIRRRTRHRRTGGSAKGNGRKVSRVRRERRRALRESTKATNHAQRLDEVP